jgi:hypothetical protein
MKVVSGGQTGVDRAALDAAIKMSVPHGGWCPKGRLAEDGCIDKCYRLKSTAGSDYETRTEKNVVDSDGTLVICRYKPNGGTLLTILFCAKHGKPVFHVTPKNIKAATQVKKILAWIDKNGIKTLNVAGPRASKDKEIYDITFKLMVKLLEKLETRLPGM